MTSGERTLARMAVPTCSRRGPTTEGRNPSPFEMRMRGFADTTVWNALFVLRNESLVDVEWCLCRDPGHIHQTSRRFTDPRLVEDDRRVGRPSRRAATVSPTHAVQT